MSQPPVNFIRFLFDGAERTGEGRDAWALSELVKAGDKGCTPLDNPGPRWSAYVLKWRKRGIQIETIHESHGGAFAGRHARYVLRSLITVLELRTAAGADAVAA